MTMKKVFMVGYVYPAAMVAGLFFVNALAGNDKCQTKEWDELYKRMPLAWGFGRYVIMPAVEGLGWPYFCAKRALRYFQ